MSSQPLTPALRLVWPAPGGAPRLRRVLHNPCRMDDDLYQAPRGGKLHFSHCRDLKHKGSDFPSWERVSASSVSPSDPRLCMWCREDLRRHRAALERKARSPESSPRDRSPEELLGLAQQLVEVGHQAIDLAHRLGPPAKRAMLAAGQARSQLKERRAARRLRRAERKQREIEPADHPTSTYDADAEGEEITDADVLDAADGRSDGQAPSE